MAHVTDGYPEGLDYLKLVFNTLSPAYIKLCLNLSGYPGPSIADQFTYAELGAGFGVSIAGWASQYPRAAFHCIDYNRNQTAWTEKLARAAGLSNLHVHGMSIGEALELELPMFDFIVAHGLYSWVNEGVREQTRAFFKKFLKPGGCVYISYNAMPGFKDIEPMRHLILQEARKNQTKDPLTGVRTGLALLDALRKAGAAYFTVSPQAGARLERWLTDDPDYLAAELLTGSHRAYHVMDLAAELRDLHWAARANMIDLLAAQKDPPRLAGILKGASPLMAESMRDLFYNTSFRSDLFLAVSDEQPSDKGREPLFSEPLSTSFTLARMRKPLPPSASRHNFEADLRDPIYPLLQSALVAGPKNLAQLSDILQFSSQDILHALCVMAALDWVHPGPAPVTPDRTARMVLFNDALSELFGGNSLMPILSASGGWINPEDQLEHLVVLAKLKGKSINEYLFRILYEDGADPSMTESSFRNVMAEYLTNAGDRISLFMQRHGLC